MQRIRGPLSIIGLAAAAAGWSGWGGCGGSIPEHRPRYGVHQDLTYDGLRWRRELAVDRARDIRAEISRNSLLWHKIEAQQGRRDWGRADAVLDELAVARIEPLFVVVGSPRWASGAKKGSSDSQFYVPPPGPEFKMWLRYYRDFVRAAVRRYRGRVNKWELWNEENESYFWKPRPNLDQYARLYGELRRTILEEDPNAEVAVGGLSGIAAGAEIRGLHFLQKLIATGVQIDHVALHPYPSDGHAPNVHRRGQDNFDDIGLVHDYLRDAGVSAQIWVTEWGWSSASLGAERQASYVEASLKRIRDRFPYVEVATYFLDYDRPPNYYQGLFDSEFDPKPSAETFSSFMKRLRSDAG
jgi:polysaccharide biosynthesis protein PslG